ncbi:MAG: hypothetical protein WDO15_10460 [Bacteroidota bacterium]
MLTPDTIDDIIVAIARTKDRQGIVGRLNDFKFPFQSIIHHSVPVHPS